MSALDLENGWDVRILRSAIGAALSTHPASAGLPVDQIDALRDEIVVTIVERFRT